MAEVLRVIAQEGSINRVSFIGHLNPRRPVSVFFGEADGRPSVRCLVPRGNGSLLRSVGTGATHEEAIARALRPGDAQIVIRAMRERQALDRIRREINSLDVVEEQAA